ncbi:MAG: c-type cytochrome [Saprospiraceae bacterium]|nr:c-type cytochrome [Saprospiraceae bacterium]
MSDPHKSSLNTFVLHIRSIMLVVFILTVVLVFLIFQIFNTSDSLIPSFNNKRAVSENVKRKFDKKSTDYWQAPELTEISGSAIEQQIIYGKDLIAHTAKYLGPKGSVAQITNGMNCQNCHLDAGTKIYGNNYGSVASTFPKLRARSGSIENVYKRVNDCIERSLNGQPLDTLSSEMQAIKAYFLFLGRNVEKGTQVRGSGLKDLPFLDRAASPENGKKTYMTKCANCHQKSGDGLLNGDHTEFVYPPLWGPSSFSAQAGLYRISNMAKYIKYNMPLGTTHNAPQLSDEESWDLSAFINTQPRPFKNMPNDWPDVSKKPFDHPFGQFNDEFSESQHKFGPFKPIIEAHKK